MRFSPKFLAFFILLLPTETAIVLFVHDSFVRPFVGDVLVVALIVFFVRTFSTASPI